MGPSSSPSRTFTGSIRPRKSSCHGWSRAWHELAARALEIAREVDFSYGVGVAERALGRIDHTRGRLPEAEGHLQRALQAFTAIEGRWEMGRTRLALTALADAQGDRRALDAHLREAWSLFRVLDLSTYVDRTERLAAQLGVLVANPVDDDREPRTDRG